MENEIEKIVNKYKIFRNNALVIPHGYWTVKVAINDITKEKSFIKTIKTDTINKMPYIKSIIRNENNIIQKLEHPSIITLIDQIQTANNMYQMTEYCESTFQINEITNCEDLQDIITQLVNVFRYLNEKQIIHGNLKPESILYKNGKIKLTDFFFAKNKNSANNFDIEFLLYGNIKYAPPELLQRNNFTEKADVWSLGTIIFELLSKKHPYCDAHKTITRENLSKYLLENKIILPPLMNDPMNELLSGMLCPLEANRFTWEQVFSKFDRLEKQHFSEIDDIMSFTDHNDLQEQDITNSFHEGESLYLSKSEPAQEKNELQMVSNEYIRSGVTKTPEVSKTPEPSKILEISINPGISPLPNPKKPIKSVPVSIILPKTVEIPNPEELKQNILDYYLNRRKNALLYNRVIKKMSHMFIKKDWPFSSAAYIKCISALLQSLSLEHKRIKTELCSKEPVNTAISTQWKSIVKSFEFDKLKDELRIDCSNLEKCKKEFENELVAKAKNAKNIKNFLATNTYEEKQLTEIIAKTFQDLKQKWATVLSDERALFLWELSHVEEFKEHFGIPFSLEEKNLPEVEKKLEDFEGKKETFLGLLYKK